MNNFNQGRSSALDRMSEALMKRMAHRGGRVDLAMHDWKTIRKNEAKILASYNPALGAPSSQTVASWVIGSHDGRLVPHIDTLRYHPRLNAFSIMVSSLTLTRPVKDMRNMTPIIAGVKYLDQETATNWVVTNNDGQKILKQDVDMDINAILANSKAKTTSGLRLSMVEKGVVMQASMGDRVTFFHNGKTRTGVITGVGETGYRMATSKGACTAAVDSIVDILEAGAESENMTKQELVDFFTRCYGDEDFAKQLVKAAFSKASDEKKPAKEDEPEKEAKPADPEKEDEPAKPDKPEDKGDDKEDKEDKKAEGSWRRKIGLKGSMVSVAKKSKGCGGPVTLMRSEVDLKHRDVSDIEGEHYAAQTARPRYGYQKADEVATASVNGKRIPIIATSLKTRKAVRRALTASDKDTLMNSRSPLEASRRLGLVRH